MAVPVCRVEEGTVTEVTVVIIPHVARTKIVAPANLIHPDAPSTFMVAINRDYSQFVFPPSTNQSNLVQASRLGLKFYSSFGPTDAARVLVTEDEKKNYNLTDFQVRLSLLPSEDPRSVDPMLVAIPVTTEGLNGLLSPHLAKSGRGYPVVLLSKEPIMAVGPRPARGSSPCGLPVLPPLCLTTPGDDPTPSDVLTSVRAAWAAATAPQLVEAENWIQATSLDPVVAGEIPAPRRWPAMVAEDTADNEGSNLYFDCVLIVVMMSVS